MGELEDLREEIARLRREREEAEEALRDRNAVILGLQEERRELIRLRRDQALGDYLTGIHRVNFLMKRLVPAPRTSAIPRTLSEGSKSSATTSGRTSIVGKFYPQKLRVWTDFDETCRAAFARVQAAVGSQPLFPSALSVGHVSESLMEELPSEFLGSEAFINELKTSYFLHETLQKPAQRILNAYLQAIGAQKKLFFDNRTVGWRPPSSDVAMANAAEGADAAPAAVPARPPPKTQPDCLVLCADILTSTAELEAAAAAEQAEAGAGADQDDDVAAEPADTVRHVHRISIAEHKAVHRLRAAAVARFARGTMDESFIVQLAEIARSAKAPARTTTGTAATAAAGSPDANAIMMVQEDAVRQAERGPPGQVFFARALTQAFHYMVAAGVEYGYMASGETLTLLRVPKDDQTTLLYHTALFPLYTRLQLGADGQVVTESDTTLPAPPAQTGGDVDIAELGVSLLTAVSLLAFESQPEPVRQRSINLSQLARFPNAPETSVSLPSSRQSSRKRRNDDDDDGDGRGSDGDDGNDSNNNGSARGRLTVPKHGARRPSPLKRARSANSNDDNDNVDNDDNDDKDNASSVGDTRSERRQYKRQRVGRQYDNIVGPTLPSPLDPSTFRPIRPYCSQACLLSLMRGGELDAQCPNVILHRQALQRDGTDLHMRSTAHAITATELHELVRLQLLANAEQDCHCFLEQGLSGAIGCLFKITITGYGYTFSAKGVEEHFSGRLRREVRVYDALAPQQGSILPVCLGVVELLLPWPMANGALVTHMLLMSYAGRPLYRVERALRGRVDVEHETQRTLDELARAGFVDNDTESNGNLTWCNEVRRVMKIDFDHAHVRPGWAAATGAAGVAGAAMPRRLAAVCQDDSGLRRHGKASVGAEAFDSGLRRLVVESLLLA